LEPIFGKRGMAAWLQIPPERRAAAYSDNNGHSTFRQCVDNMGARISRSTEKRAQAAVAATPDDDLYVTS
jgi:hypothetical protein